MIHFDRFCEIFAYIIMIWALALAFNTKADARDHIIHYQNTTALGVSDRSQNLNTMRFYLVIESKQTAMHHNRPSIWIAAQGPVTENTPEDFRHFMRQIPPSLRPQSIRLHSGGGHLLGGIQLGRLIRAVGLHTEIGVTLKRGSHYVTDKGRCASACAYAFLGGATRFALANELGIHSYGFRHKYSGEIVTIEQIAPRYRQLIEGMLSGYIEEMQIKPLFLARAMATPLSDMHYFSDQELRDLGIGFGRQEAQSHMIGNSAS